jgi:long-chain acyl-CoA synthetase
LVEQKGDLIKVVGRDTEVINVGGLKFVASEVERVALEFPHVAHVKATARNNPLTGQHVEIALQLHDEQAFEGVDAFLAFLASRLPRHMVPRRVRLGSLSVNHRFKKA